MLLRARYIVPVDRPPIENGAILIENGRIAAIGTAGELPGPATIDFGDAVLLPGFVNAHTHLELTHLAGEISPSMGFVPWIQTLAGRLIRDSVDPCIARATVEEGVRQSLRSGVTTIGDITRDPDVVRSVLTRSPIRAVSFGEVIGIGSGRDRWPRRLDAAAGAQHATANLVIGISPHAPYTVEPDGLRACAARATNAKAPLCIHTAETPEEERFTRRLEGGLVELLKGAGVWDETMVAGGMSPVQLVDHTGVLTSTTLLAHANYVSDDDIAIIARRGASVAYCPRTHAAFGHAPHRFREMLAAGINVCLGTDSLASNPSLSILDELRFLRQHAGDVPPDRLLCMATRNGAAALGFGQDRGMLAVGEVADLVTVPLPRAAKSWSSIFEDSAPPIAVYVAGRQISLLG